MGRRSMGCSDGNGRILLAHQLGALATRHPRQRNRVVRLVLSFRTLRKLQWQDIVMEIRQRGNHGKLIVSSVASTREATNVDLNNRFPLEDVLEAQQFDRELLTSIFEVASVASDV